MNQPVEQKTIERGRALYDLGATAIFACKRTRASIIALCAALCRPGGKVDLLVAVHGTSRPRSSTSATALRRSALERLRHPLPGLSGRRARRRQSQRLQIHRRRRHPLRPAAHRDGRGGRRQYGQDWSRLPCSASRAAGISPIACILHRTGSGRLDRRVRIVTLLDPQRDWWVGIRDLKQRFALISMQRRCAVPVQMLVGDADLETWEITISPAAPTGWRRERCRPHASRAAGSLRRSFEAAGVQVRFDLLPGVSHDRMKALASVQDFLAGVLNQGARADGGMIVAPQPEAVEAGARR